MTAIGFQFSVWLFPSMTRGAHVPPVARRPFSANRSPTIGRSPQPKRLFGFFAGLTVAGFLAACVTTAAMAQEEETEGITGYVACLDAAVRRIDDGRSDVAAVAAAAKGACAARFPEPIPGKVTAATQKKYEKRMQARQMELSVMVVQDLRGQP
jgi:hypothetical protein